jgi:protein-tyrosine phosphatase
MAAIISKIEELVAAGRKVYLHCRGGIDRTGGVVACWFAKHHKMTAQEAMNTYKKCWQTNPKSERIAWMPAIQQSPEYVEEFGLFAKK